MKEMLVSFIIPAYNAADTIERCLNSIVTQSWGDMSYEIIVIDDASTDDTCDVVAAYQSKHPNITLLKQPENHRQGAARNRGVKIAKGEYVCFVDSDDAVTEGIVSAIRLAKEKQTDMTILHYANANENGDITSEGESLSFTDGQIFTGIEMQNRHPYWCAAPWAYIYNKEFLNRVNYPFAEDVLYEDTDFIIAHLYQAKRMAYSRELGYMMYFRESSTTHSMTHKNLADYLLLGTRMMALFERMNSRLDIGDLILENEDIEKFAEGVLEGACYNVAKACMRLIKLADLSEVRAYYKRVDIYVNRRGIVTNKRYRSYYWNAWTGMCLKYKKVAIAALAVMMPIYKGMRR